MYLDSNVTIMVGDLNRSVSFYVDTLGLKLKARYGDGFAEVQAPGLTIGLHPRRPGEPPVSGERGMSIGLAVEDLAAQTALLEGKGVTVSRRADAAADFAEFQDPDGTPLYIIQLKGH